MNNDSNILSKQFRKFCYLLLIILIIFGLSYLKMNKDNKFLPIIVSLIFVFLVKTLTIIIKTFFLNSRVLENIGKGSGIFSKPASTFPYFLDYVIVISYILLLILLYKYYWILQNQNIKNFIYFSCILLVFLSIGTSIVFKEYRGWDLSLYCITDISNDIKNSNINIYDFEYQKIEPGLSPLIWLVYNKICNFNFLGFSYLNIYYWIQMFFGLLLILFHFEFSIMECICLATGLNLSLLHMIRTGNYGYIFAILMAISLRNLAKRKSINLNIALLAVITFFKLQYLIVIFLFLLLQKVSFKNLLSFLLKISIFYTVYFGIQAIFFRNSLIDYLYLMFNGYLTNELTFEAGITNPVVSQFISRFFQVELNISLFFIFGIVLYGFYSFNNRNSKFLIGTSLFNRNKSYDSNYLLTAVEKKFVTEFIFAFCFVPNILFVIGSSFSLGPLSELLYVPSLLYVVMLSNKRS